MKLNKKWNLNKILIIVAIVLVVIAIIAVSLFFALKEEPEEISYDDSVVAKNLFVQMAVNIRTKEMKRDSKDTTFKEEFDVDEQKENLIFSSQEEFKNYFANSTFEVEFKDDIAYITNKYQTKKLILEVSELKGDFTNAEKVEEMNNGVYILTFDSQKKTKEAYEYLKNIYWIKKIELDEVLKIRSISDESQTMYGNNENNDDDSKVYGVKAMGLDNYQNIIQENGNPSDVVVGTIGYGAAVNNSYFGGRINDNSYNFIKDSSNIYETIPQGSRILEVIQESTTHNVKLMPLMVVDEENYTTLSSIVKAISYATKNSDVICYELVHKQDYMIDLVLKNAFKENVPVCAVTTSEVSLDENYPANNTTTIAVTSLDKTSKITNYSGSGNYIDFSAYSTDIQEILNTSSSISKWSGAEYSNAQIVSVIALIKTYHKEYTILEIYNMIRNYCKDLGNEGKDEQYGYGCPDFSELKISDIDKIAPEMEDIVYDNEKWEKAKNIQIKAKDEIRILGWAITNTEEKPDELNKLETLATTLDVTSTLDKNGKYYIWVSDSANNISYKLIEINKIDNTEPKIQNAIDTSKLSSEKYVTIFVTATDDESGLHETAYSWDGLAWGKDNNQLKVTENGTYTVYVRDNMENIAKKEIVVDSFPKEGKAIIEEGNIIKNIVVSPNWNEDTNDDVKITFNNNLNIAEWRITETSEMPADFETESSGSENEEDNQNSINTENTNRIENLFRNYINDVSTNTVNNEIEEQNVNTNTSTTNSSSIQGYSNLTITVSLKENTQYYVWIKKGNGNVDVQSFRITKS